MWCQFLIAFVIDLVVDVDEGWPKFNSVDYGLHRSIALFRFCNLPSDVICWSPNPADISKYVGNPRMFVSSLISAHLNFIDDEGYRSNGRDLSQHLTALCPSTLSQHLQNYRPNVNFSKNGWQRNSRRITSLLVLNKFLQTIIISSIQRKVFPQPILIGYSIKIESPINGSLCEWNWVNSSFFVFFRFFRAGA